MEPADAAVHLRIAERDPHRGSQPDAAALPGRAPLHFEARRRGQDDPLRRHQTPGAGGDRLRSRPGGGVLREPPVARGTAHQLPDDPQEHRQVPGASGDHRKRRSGRLLEQGLVAPRQAPAADGKDAQRHREDGPAARRRLYRGSQERDDRGAGSEETRYPDRGDRGHRLRPRPHRLRDPGERRRPPGDPPLRRAHCERLRGRAPASRVDGLRSRRGRRGAGRSCRCRSETIAGKPATPGSSGPAASRPGRGQCRQC